MFTQQENLARVRHRLHDVILRFVSERLAAGVREFHGPELHEFCGANASSVDRILRLLRAEGRLDYRILDRSKSHYELLPLTYTQQRLFA